MKFSEAYDKVGSSPHSRGTLWMQSPLKLSDRIIPAFAGNTHSDRPCCDRAGDHPRIRGEHLCQSPNCRLSWGSSPHSRGTRCLHPVPAYPARIIPAFAGNTLYFGALIASPRDHPRIRGEHKADRQFLGLPMGSSPHSRGTHVNIARYIVMKGIIPAFAGNTDRVSHHRHTYGDHPRIRGEHL